MEFAGRATWTKHYRDGVELPEIARDENYDFNFQVWSVTMHSKLSLQLYSKAILPHTVMN